MIEVAALLQGWLSQDHVKWEADPGVVEWAKDYGDDLKRAWEECPRADYLMAIAGACEAPEEPVVLVVAACAREALKLLPRREARSTKAVLYAEGYRRGRAFDPTEARKVADDAMEVVGAELDARVEAAERARAAMVKKIRSAWARIVEEAMKGSVEAARRDGLEGVSRLAMIEAARDALVAATATDKGMRLFRPREEEIRRVLAGAHAARAAASAATVATSADVSVHSLLLLGKLSQAGLRPENAAGVMRASEIALRSGARVLTEGALVFDHAAEAFSLAETWTDAAWDASIRAFFEALVAAGMTERALPVSAPTEAMAAALSLFASRAKQAKQREHADALRAAIPFTSLKVPGAEDAVDPAKDSRRALRSSLARLKPVAALLGAAPLVEALDVGLAILDAPGPLDKRRLAPVVRTCHERVQELFERGVEESEGAVQAQLREAAEVARKDVAEMARILSAMGPSAPN